jgi:lipid-A-disaccharide synthase
MPDNPRVLIVAGEASADLYGARIVEALRRRLGDPEISGIGGARMRAAGVSLFADCRELAVVGLVEVLSHWKPIHRAFAAARSRLREDPPDLVLLIDYPDFNLRLARAARQAGVPVLYFIGPQVWAWRRSRLKSIAATVDRMLVVLPFEESIYREAGVPVEFVGHPLLDLLPVRRDGPAGRLRFGLHPSRPVLGILPGSRRRELGFHLPVMLEAASRIRDRVGEIQPVIPLASTVEEKDLEDYLKPYARRLPDLRLLRGEPGEALGTMDAAMVKSGTATLEAGLMGVPMAVVYRTTPVTYFLASLLTDVRTVGLVNIVAGKSVAPELVQSDCTPEMIASALFDFFTDPRRAEAARRELAPLRERLGRPGCFDRVADAAAEFLLGNRRTERRKSAP